MQLPSWENYLERPKQEEVKAGILFVSSSHSLLTHTPSRHHFLLLLKACELWRQPRERTELHNCLMPSFHFWFMFLFSLSLCRLLIPKLLSVLLNLWNLSRLVSAVTRLWRAWGTVCADSVYVFVSHHSPGPYLHYLWSCFLSLC